MSPSTGTLYSEDFSLELARNSSAAPQRRFSSSVVLAGMGPRPHILLRRCSRRTVHFGKARGGASPYSFPAKLPPGQSSMADDSDTKRIPINELRQEEGARELTEFAEMEPYLNFAVALMQGNDPAPELEGIRQLPLEKRYVWRIASALKWGFADFDDLGVDADKQTLSPEDFANVMDLLKFRPMRTSW